MLGGLALLYASAQTLSGAIAYALPHAVGRRAFWHAAPIGAAAIVASALGHSEMALGMVTGASVAVLSLVPGVCKVMATSEDSGAAVDSRCAMLLGAVLLLWVIGLRAEINWLGAICLAVQGLLLVGVWRESADVRRPSIGSLLIFVLSIAVAALASILAVHGAVRLRGELSTLTSAIFAAALVTPVLILPVLGECIRLTEEHRANDARIVQTVMAMILITGILPLCVAVSYWRARMLAGGVGEIAFPYGTWRVDSVVLVILALWIFSGQSFSRGWRKFEGMLLILIYGVYLISLAWIGQYL